METFLVYSGVVFFVLLSILVMIFGKPAKNIKAEKGRTLEYLGVHPGGITPSSHRRHR